MPNMTWARCLAAYQSHGCTQAKMADPVIAADGHSYERGAIEVWLQKHDTSPVNSHVMPHKRVVPNISIRCLAAKF